MTTVKQYAVWQKNEQEPYWNYYDTLEDAVSENGDGCEVFVFEGRLLGKFKRKVELVKIKRRKKRTK